MDIHPDQTEAATAAEQDGWSPLDFLRSLGRAASIAAGASPAPIDFHGFGIVTTGKDGAYSACIAHHRDKAICLPWQIRRQISDARFPSAEEAVQHARFLIASGALNFR
jgi:hypothetical protein